MSKPSDDEGTIAQLFETSIGDRKSGYVFSGIVVPRRSISDAIDLKDRESLLYELGLREIFPVDAKSIEEVIAVTLEPEEELPTGTDDAFNLAKRVSTEKCIPFENSAIDLHSLKDVIAKGTGTALGAYVGFVAVGAHPLALIVVPAGIIICGAAHGIAKALEQGLQYKLLRFMGVPVKGGKTITPPGSGGTSQKGKPSLPPDASTRGATKKKRPSLNA